MILFIDTSGYEQLRFAVVKDKKVSDKKIKISYPETEKALSYFGKFLKSNKVKLDQVDKIVIVSGPGSFTGIRVGVSMALAFSFAKNIPLYAIEQSQVPKKLADLKKLKLKKVSADFDPDYGAEPNITLSKK